jgi:hypothetical protein
MTCGEHSPCVPTTQPLLQRQYSGIQRRYSGIQRRYSGDTAASGSLHNGDIAESQQSTAHYSGLTAAPQHVVPWVSWALQRNATQPHRPPPAPWPPPPPPAPRPRPRAPRASPGRAPARRRSHRRRRDSLAKPPACMPPGGAKLLYSRRLGVRVRGWLRRRLVHHGNLRRGCRRRRHRCAASPACGPPGGTDTFDSNGTAVCASARRATRARRAR